MGSSLDQIGPLTRTVEDAEIIFNTIRGKDELDATSIDRALYAPPAPKKKIGVPRQLFKEGVDPDVLQRFEETLKKLEAEGYELVDISLPSAHLALAIYYIVMPAEASSNLSRFDGVRYGSALTGESLLEDYAKTRGEGFGPEVRRRIMLGTYVLSAGYYDAYFGKALAARAKLTEEFTRALESVDAIAVPTTPTPAAKIGEKSDPLSMYLMDVFTVTANLTGHPAISIPMDPVKRDGSDLPVGIQLTAAHGNEAALFSLAKLLE
jgi:aspartyl-tRNA(Asn)/glutamyl-tRNA(Gln) amidotransferase subunit A